MKNVSCSLADFGTQIITDLERFFYLLNLLNLLNLREIKKTSQTTITTLFLEDNTDNEDNVFHVDNQLGLVYINELFVLFLLFSKHKKSV